MTMMKLPTNKCLRCGHTWIPRSNKRAAACPKCYNRRWDERKEKPRATTSA